ncbi:MAG: methyltransferase domain-containing protein [Gammaproteobacteria bacterium]|nr:methyltransferase domain-containing protein [Gammaproteobacteria bacterium]
MTTPPGMEQQVRQANQRFYNLIAPRYEEIDGRRTSKTLLWLRRRLQLVAERSGGGYLLDLGCGSGVMMRSAAGLFDEVVGIDISTGILALAKEHGTALCADGSALPLASASMDAVVCFAALHHIYDHQPLLAEVYRVLRPGGVFYADHDMTLAFSNRFHWPLALYRTLFNGCRRYQRADNRLDRELYQLTEIHEQGIDQDQLLKQLGQSGFSEITTQYHWYGLNPWVDRLFGERPRSKGMAPLLALWATK